MLQHFFKNFGKTETPLAAVLLGRKEETLRFSCLFLSLRGSLEPLMARKFGDAEDRTGGLGLAERKEHYLTAAPFHQFDVGKAD